MNGVTILYTKQALTLFETILLSFSVAGVLIFAVVALAMLDESITVSCVSLAVSIVLFIVIIRIPQSDTLYEITVDESVSYQELSARYEIVSQRGQILTVREKEQNDGSHSTE